MKEYEQKICNIIDNLKAEMRYQCDKVYEQAYKQGHKRGYAEGYELGKQDGYKDGKADTPFTDTEEAEKKAYERGLNEAWEVAGKLFKVPTDALLELFERRNPYLDFSAQEVLAKIKEYEDKQKQDAEIKLGDEIVYSDGIKGIVVGISNIAGQISVLNNEYDVPQLIVKNRAKKTGRTFPQIAEALKELRGAENDKRRTYQKS